MREMIAMELCCGACSETGMVLACRGGEESSEAESEGVVEGLRGFQGEPRFGLPRGRGRGMAGSVQRTERKKSTW
jgi:hypothetical protein